MKNQEKHKDVEWCNLSLVYIRNQLNILAHSYVFFPKNVIFVNLILFFVLLKPLKTGINSFKIFKIVILSSHTAKPLKGIEILHHSIWSHCVFLWLGRRKQNSVILFASISLPSISKPWCLNLMVVYVSKY